MKSQLKINRKMTRIMASLVMAILVPTVSLAFNSINPKDTVIIELNNNNKIVIITSSKEDLATLERYDINQMIRDLNNQLSDSVQYMEIKDGKAYVNEKELKDWKINEDEVHIKLGGLQVDVDADKAKNWDGDDWNIQKKRTYETERVDRTTHHFNIDLGINNWLENGSFPDDNNELYSIKPFGSWYLALNSVNKTWVGGPVFLEWGLGISWYNWKMQDADVVIQEGANNITFTPAPVAVNGIKSKLTTSYVNAQLVPMFDFSKGRKKVTSYESSGVRIKRYSRQGFRFGMGGYAGYRLGSHTKFVFKEDGNRDRDKEKDNFFLENFRYGLRAQIGWKGMELFGMYDLNNVFASGRGPDLNAITFGISL